MKTPVTAATSAAEVCGSGSLTVEQAVATLLAETPAASGQEVVALTAAVARVLAAPVIAPRPVPGHDNAAVDGYAVRGVDLPSGPDPICFRVIGAALAGQPYSGSIGSGEAVRIMTGAILPDGADTVVMREQVEVTEAGVFIGRGHMQAQNVRLAGEDLRSGETVLHPGRWLTPADIGVLASVGNRQVTVRRRVHVGVLSTGSEVRALGQPLAAGEVYDSNRYMLMTALRRLGAEVHDLGVVPDDPAALRRRLEEASLFSDAIISSGGVSVGEADFIRPVLSTLGRMQFWKVAMKPGHPFAFGRIGEATFFGLPGNPVATLISFYWLVKPALEQAMGIMDRPLIPLVPARAESAFRKKPGRMEFHRAILRAEVSGEYRVAGTGDQGSGILRSMSLANCLVVLPSERGPVSPGDRVAALPLAAVI